MDEEKTKQTTPRRQTLEEPITARLTADGLPMRDAPSTGTMRDGKEEMYKRFMGSPFVEWAPFANDQGLDPAQTRNIYPIPKWIAEKKKAIALVQAENIAQALFDHKSAWHRDVLKTLQEYPAVSDAMLGILKRRMNDIIEDINHDTQDRAKAVAQGRVYLDKRRFDKWTTKELQQLAGAVKAVTESKHRSLCLSDWKPRLAEEATNPAMLGAPIDESNKKDTGWIMELTGGDQLTTARVHELFDRYLDAPDSSMSPQTSPIVQKAAQDGLELPITAIDGNGGDPEDDDDA